MANNFESNITQKLLRKFMEHFESKRVLSRNVNTQLLAGAFDASTGDTVNFKRPVDYTSSRTAQGDISSGTANSIITGKASGVVQDYITVELDWQEADEAIKMDQLDQLIEPAARRIKTDLEVDFASFMHKNTALLAGTYGTAVSTWAHVAEAGAVMTATGVPDSQPWYYTMNPYTQTALASAQRSLGAVDPLVRSAHEQATISDNFAGMQVMTGTTLPTVSIAAGADRAGTLTGAPTLTYVGAKDTMTQTLPVTAFQANLVVKKGEVLTIAGRYRLNLDTREPVIDASGSKVLWSATVNADVTLGASGEGNIVVTGPAIWESGGAFNTVDTAPATSDVVTLLGSASTTYQPNLFWHKNAFGIGSVPIKKLYSTDTLATNEDGLQIRCSKGASIRENKQIVRFDLRPAYACLNPFFAGQGFGSS